MKNSPALPLLPKSLAQPAQRALVGAGITEVKQLTTMSKTEIERLHGIGPNAVRILEDELKRLGLSFRGT